MAHSTDYLQFLEGLYGRAAIDSMLDASGLDRASFEKVSDAFMPLFLERLLDVRTWSHAKHTDMKNPTFAEFWPSEITQAMQSFVQESAKAAKDFTPQNAADSRNFPFNLFSRQTDSMDRLYQVFMGQMAQGQLLEEISRSTGVARDKLEQLFPMLTTYGLMPLMPPSLDDPSSWMDYWGEMSRRNFRQASRGFEALPDPVHAAFDGLLAGLYPQSARPAAQSAQSAETEKMQQIKEASLQMQASYIKGLNSLFDRYQQSMKPSDKD